MMVLDSVIYHNNYSLNKRGKEHSLVGDKIWYAIYYNIINYSYKTVTMEVVVLFSNA